MRLYDCYRVIIKSSSEKRSTTYKTTAETMTDVTRILGTYQLKRGYEIDEVKIFRELRFG